MERRQLGPSDLRVSRVGVGTAPIGSRPGEWWVDWGPQDDADSVRAVHAAVDGGVNWVDTAPFYGWGHAEEVVGRALDGRDDVLVFTKCGTWRRDDGDDYMDLSPIVEGKVRHGGLSNHPPDLVERALAVGPAVSLQFQYSAMVRDHEEKLLPCAQRHGLGAIVWAPLASGFLTDDFSVDDLSESDFRRTHAFAELDLADTRKELKARGGGSVTRGALEFVLTHPAVTGAIVGIRDEREARELAALA